MFPAVPLCSLTLALMQLQIQLANYEDPFIVSETERHGGSAGPSQGHIETNSHSHSHKHAHTTPARLEFSVLHGFMFSDCGQDSHDDTRRTCKQKGAKSPELNP